MTKIVNNEEKWEKCPFEGYEHYEVSDLGRVRNTKTKNILKPYAKDSYRDYRRYDLYSGGRKKTISAHRLVWMAHKGEIPLTKQVDHLDNDKANNRLDNLQLLTPADNTRKRGGGWKKGEGKYRNRPKPKRPMSEEGKEKCRTIAKAIWADRKAALIEP